MRLLWQTSARQYGRGFGFGQYVLMCRKLMRAVLGGKAFKGLSQEDVFEELVHDWEVDSASSSAGGGGSPEHSHMLSFEQFWKAMYHLIDAWAPTTSPQDRIQWFDDIVAKITYQDATGETFFLEDKAVNDQRSRQWHEQSVHESLLVSGPTTSSENRSTIPKSW